MAEEMMRQEINKHTETVISRLDETRSKLKEDLQYNQKVWNDLLHGTLGMRTRPQNLLSRDINDPTPGYRKGADVLSSYQNKILKASTNHMIGLSAYKTIKDFRESEKNKTIEDRLDQAEDLVKKLDKLDEIGMLGPNSVVNQFSDSISNLRNLILANKFLNHHGNLAIAMRGIIDDLQPLVTNPKQVNPLTKQRIEQMNDIVGQTIFDGFDLNTLQRTVASTAKEHAANIAKHEPKLRDITVSYVKNDLDNLLKTPSQDKLVIQAQRELAAIQNVPANAQLSARDSSC